MDSPLNPFKNEHGETYTSRHCVNIEKQLGYTYGPGSLDERARPGAAVDLAEGHSTKTIRITGIDRAVIRGSFLVSAFANIDGKRYHVGTEPVLSRWSVPGCANCQTHLEVKAFFRLHTFREESLTNAGYEVEVRTRDGVLNQRRSPALSTLQEESFHVEVH